MKPLRKEPDGRIFGPSHGTTLAWLVGISSNKSAVLHASEVMIIKDEIPSSLHDLPEMILEFWREDHVILGSQQLHRNVECVDVLFGQKTRVASDDAVDQVVAFCAQLKHRPS